MIRLWQKILVSLLGLVVGFLAVAQFILGRVLLTGTADIGTRMAHEHTGYLLTIITLVYVVLTVYLVLTQPSRAGGADQD